MERRFSARFDWWAIPFLTYYFGMFISPFALGAAVYLSDRDFSAVRGPWAAAALAMALWVRLSLYYRIDGTHVRTCCYPFHWNFSLQQIESLVVEPVGAGLTLTLRVISLHGGPGRRRPFNFGVTDAMGFVDAIKFLRPDIVVYDMRSYHMDCRRCWTGKQAPELRFKSRFVLSSLAMPLVAAGCVGVLIFVFCRMPGALNIGGIVASVCFFLLFFGFTVFVICFERGIGTQVAVNEHAIRIWCGPMRSPLPLALARRLRLNASQFNFRQQIRAQTGSIVIESGFGRLPAICAGEKSLSGNAARLHGLWNTTVRLQDPEGFVRAVRKFNPEIEIVDEAQKTQNILNPVADTSISK